MNLTKKEDDSPFAGNASHHDVLSEEIPPSKEREGYDLSALGYQPELQRNRSMLTLLFQSLAIAAVRPTGSDQPLSICQANGWKGPVRLRRASDLRHLWRR